MTQASITVLLADDDRGIIAALTDLLDAEPGLRVVAAAEDADEAIRLAGIHRPDVAVIDTMMPGGGARAVREIVEVATGTRVVALSAHDDRTSVASMIRAGALGYVIKGAPIDEIVDAVRRASRGLASLSGDAASVLSQEIDERLGELEFQEERSRRRIAEVTDVLRSGAIRAVYQPIVEISSLATVGYEGLARFDREPVRGPDVWFASADKASMRVELELAAIRAAIARVPELPPHTYLSLNLSPATAVSTELALLLLGVAPEQLVLEITEHAPVPDYAALRDGLAELRAAGARLAVDDAGAGFASLRHILLLEPDLIKLDISLTRGIEADRARRSLARALVAFSAEMGIRVIAEGIETEAELGALRDLGVDFGQGYLLGRPGDLPAQVGATRARPGGPAGGEAQA